MFTWMVFCLSTASAAPEVDWPKVISEVTPAIVSIRIASNRAFDTERPSVSVATGFVVDKEQGIILTNRHVVEPGPVTSTAVFLNNEEVGLQPIYRDPVHDFGFYKFNPEELRHQELIELELCSECVSVGDEVRLIGNDAGEKISILEATIARLDRNAPNYGKGRYNDFNTFYIQAAAGSSGGSSGSPIINQGSKVIALNAGGSNRAASSFFLPLPRIERALGLIQDGKAVSRGTLLSTLVDIPFDKASRLGLPDVVETELREAFPNRNGVLMLERLIPNSPLNLSFRPGDILYSIAGEKCTDFIRIEEILDENVGKTIPISFYRNRELLSKQITVSDLHSVSPDRYVEACGGIFHNLSYQQARHYRLPLEGVFVASAGYCFRNSSIYSGSVITELYGQHISNVDDFWKVLTELKDEQRVAVASFQASAPLQPKLNQLKWDQTWHSVVMMKRNDSIGSWDKIAEDIDVSTINVEAGTVASPVSKLKGRLAKKVNRSLVVVRSQIPHRIGGVYDTGFFGTGVVLDAEEGIVAVDKDTVPIHMVEPSITFGASLTLPAKVVYLHPDHNLALIKYDPKLIKAGEVNALKIKNTDLGKGKKVRLMGLNYDYELEQKKLKITGIERSPSSKPRTPFFREQNIAVYELDGAPSTVGGVIVDRWGNMLGQWASFVDLGKRDQDRNMYILPSYVHSEALAAYRSQLAIRSLRIELTSLNPIEAQEYGVRSEHLEKSADRFFIVSSISLDSPASKLLEVGDIVLSVDGEQPSVLRQIEQSYRKPQTQWVVLRSGQKKDIALSTVKLQEPKIDRVLYWGGAMLHDVQSTLPDQRRVAEEGAYVSWCAYGAPCSRDGLRPTYRIVQVNGESIANLEDFERLVGKIAATESVRMNVLTLRDEPRTISVRQDIPYWGTQVFRQNDSGNWQRDSVPQAE